MANERTVNLTSFDESMETLVKEMKFPLGYDGKEMSDEQKKAALMTFLGTVIMS